MEIKQSKIVGFTDQKKNWEIQADYIWTGENRFLFTAENLRSGKIYDSNGVLVVDEMNAALVKVNSRSKTLTAENGISAVFIHRAAPVPEGGVFAQEPVRKKIKIHADQLKYFSVSKRTYLYNNVVIEQGKSTVFTQGVEIDNDKNIAYVDQKFTMKSGEFFVTGNQMTIYIDDDYSEMTGGVWGKMEGSVTSNRDSDPRERELRSQDAYVTCQTMKYSFPDDNESVEVNGEVRVWQNDKLIRGNSGFYFKKDRVFTVEGDVKFQAKNLWWAIKPERRDKFRNPDIKKSLSMPITLKADKLIFNSTTWNLKAIGNIKVSQEDKEVTCEKLEYNDKTGFLDLVENVNARHEKTDALESPRVVIDVNEETFEAKEKVSAEFQLKKKKKVPNEKKAD